MMTAVRGNRDIASTPLTQPLTKIAANSSGNARLFRDGRGYAHWDTQCSNQDPARTNVRVIVKHISSQLRWPDTRSPCGLLSGPVEPLQATLISYMSVVRGCMDR